MESFFTEYLLLKNIPKGEKILNPDDYIFVCLCNPSVNINTPSNNPYVYITRRSLKHIAEKGNDVLSRLLFEICSDPEEIRKGKIVNRYLLSKRIVTLSNHPYAVSIEIIDTDCIVIVTIFPSDDKYLSNFDLLWRTGVS